MQVNRVGEEQGAGGAGGVNIIVQGWRGGIINDVCHYPLNSRCWIHSVMVLTLDA